MGWLWKAVEELYLSRIQGGELGAKGESHVYGGQADQAQMSMPEVGKASGAHFTERSSAAVTVDVSEGFRMWRGALRFTVSMMGSLAGFAP